MHLVGRLAFDALHKQTKVFDVQNNPIFKSHMNSVFVSLHLLAEEHQCLFATTSPITIALFHYNSSSTSILPHMWIMKAQIKSE